MTEIVDRFPNDIIREPITKLGDPNINKQREVKLYFPFKGIKLDQSWYNLSLNYYMQYFVIYIIILAIMDWNIEKENLQSITVDNTEVGVEPHYESVTFYA